jgi:hypothetical protein
LISVAKTVPVLEGDLAHRRDPAGAAGTVGTLFAVLELSVTKFFHVKKPRSRSMETSTSQLWPASLRQPTSSDHREGAVARTIEQQTAKLPSDIFLWAACGSMAGSFLLQCAGRSHESLFVGQWAPTFLILGLYNKIVKIAGSDAEHASLRG